MSAIVIAVTPVAAMFGRSLRSMSRIANSTQCAPSTVPRRASGNGSAASPSATAYGIPWTFPEGVVSGVLMSPWASM